MAIFMNGDYWFRPDSQSSLTTIRLDGTQGHVHIGDQGHGGFLLIKSDADTTISLDGQSARASIGAGNHDGSLTVFDRHALPAILLNGANAHVEIGNSLPGVVRIRDANAQDVIVLDGDDGDRGSITLGSDNRSGVIRVRSRSGAEVFRLDGNSGMLVVGANGVEGDLIVRDGAGRTVLNVEGGAAALRLGAKEIAGLFELLDTRGNVALRLGGEGATLGIGAPKNGGNLRVYDGSENIALEVDSEDASVTIGADDKDGRLRVLDRSGRRVFGVLGSEARVTVGQAQMPGELRVKDEDGANVIQLNGAAGEVAASAFVTGAANVAAEFDLGALQQLDPGTVVVIGDNAQLIESTEAYDHKVAGVVAGAGGYQSGLLLDHGSPQGPAARVPVAFSGKVYCKVDASHGAIVDGDLLTTSPTAGHAMKAVDRRRTFGAVIGKALGSLSGGTGLIPVLMSLG